jgi:hypothetical protein
MVAVTGTGLCGDVGLTIADGRVTVVAHGATPREILTEWARVGGTTIVNLERVQGGALTIEFTNVPEQQVLDVLLRSMGGYIAAPRATPLADRSMFDRIFIMPGTLAPRASAAAAPAPVAGQMQAPTFVGMQVQPGEPDMPPVQVDVVGAPPPPPVRAPNGVPLNPAVPGVLPVAVFQPGMPSTSGGGGAAGPGGSTVPGVVVPSNQPVGVIQRSPGPTLPPPAATPQ